MLKLTKLRTIANLPSTRGIEEEELTEILKQQPDKLAERSRILTAMNRSDAEYDCGEHAGSCSRFRFKKKPTAWKKSASTWRRLTLGRNR